MTRPRQIVLGEWDSRAPVRRSAHGLKPDEIDALKALGCAICGRKDRGRLVIDHDHAIAPGKMGTRESVRGILCTKCNLAIGYIDDNPLIADAIASYLRRTRS